LACASGSPPNDGQLEELAIEGADEYDIPDDEDGQGPPIAIPSM